MPRIKFEGIEKLDNDILESIEINEDQLIKLNVLEAFCQGRGIKMNTLNVDVLESFNINISQFLERATILESNSGVGTEIEKMRTLNASNPLLVLNALHRAGKHEKAASIQRHYLDFMEAINTSLEEDTSIMKDNLSFIDNMYDVFKSALPTE